jgi:tryptophanyl-tRNA synthetase
MSKSYNNFLGLLDSPEVLRKKINKIVSGDEGPTDPKVPETSTLYILCCLFMNEAEQQNLAQKYRNGSVSYKEVKDILYDLVVAFVTPIQEKFAQISDDEVFKLLAKNATQANEIANAKINEVYKKVGFR